MSLAAALRYTLLSAAVFALFMSLVGAPAADARGPAPRPQRLWQKFPLNGQGTTPNHAQPAPVDRAPRKASPETSPQVATPQAGKRGTSPAGIALVLGLLALAAGVLFSEARWSPLRKAGRRLREPVRSDARRRPSSRGAPILALAGAAPLEPVDTRPSPVVRSASRLNPFRRGRTKTSGRAAPTEDPTHPAVVDRLAQYSLAAPETAEPGGSDALSQAEADEVPDAPPPEAADEPAGAPPPRPPALQTLHARIDSGLERAAETHLALSVVAVRLHPTADLAPDLHGVDTAVASTARQVLGEDVEIGVVDTHDDTIWLILPGVLPKRSRAVAARLGTTLAPHGHAPAIAVAGYPADGKTSDALVEHCLDEVESSPNAEEDVADTHGRRQSPFSPPIR